MAFWPSTAATPRPNSTEPYILPPPALGGGFAFSWYGLRGAGDRGAAPAALLVVPASEQAIFAPGKWRSDAGGLRPFRFPSYPTIRSAKARPSLAAASAIMLY